MSTFHAKSGLMARQQPSLSDVIHAVKSHNLWVTRFEHYLLGRDSRFMDPDEVRDHDQCALGRWLDNSCSRHFGHWPIMDRIHATHERFHFCARHLLLLHYDGETEQALDYLRNGAFKAYSELLKKQLGELAGKMNLQRPSMTSSMVMDEIFMHIHA